MAGKAKRKLDYAGWSVDIFDNDTKIDKLLDSQGWIGFSIYFFLCQKAFGSDGYFYKWGFDDCASTARKMGCGIGSGTILEVVGYCLQIGLFNKGLFDGWGVLTSKGIQRSYWTVAKSRRDKTVYKELWLLEESECEGVVFVPLNKEMSATNDHSQPTNKEMSATNDTVVKESKVKESKGNGADALLPSFNAEQAWIDTFALYPKKSAAVIAKQVWMDKLLDVIESNRKDVAELIYWATKMYLDDYDEKNPDDTTHRYVPKYSDWLVNDCDYWISEVEKRQRGDDG